jgi:hypothetical protein
VWVEFFNAISMLSIYPVAAYYVQDTACTIKVDTLGVHWKFGMKAAVWYGFLGRGVQVDRRLTPA